MLLRENYIDSYRLVNLDDSRRPLAMVAISKKEQHINRYDPLEERWDNFKAYKIAEYYGYSFDEFLDLPREQVERLFDKARKEQEKINAIAKKAEDDVRNGKALGGGK